MGNIFLSSIEINKRNLKRVLRVYKWRTKRSENQMLKKIVALIGLCVVYFLFLLVHINMIDLRDVELFCFGLPFLVLSLILVLLYDHLVVAKYVGHLVVAVYEFILIMAWGFIYYVV